jgi:hypothetical protein
LGTSLRFPEFLAEQEVIMSKSPKAGAPGTIDQSPRWEGPEENRPRGYLPAKDNPNTARDAAGENLSDPEKSDLTNAFNIAGAPKSRDERIEARAYHIWEREGRQHGLDEHHWHQAIREINEEDGQSS